MSQGPHLRQARRLQFTTNVLDDGGQTTALHATAAEEKALAHGHHDTGRGAAWSPSRGRAAAAGAPATPCLWAPSPPPGGPGRAGPRASGAPPPGRGGGAAQWRNPARRSATRSTPLRRRSPRSGRRKGSPPRSERRPPRRARRAAGPSTRRGARSLFPAARAREFASRQGSSSCFRGDPRSLRSAGDGGWRRPSPRSARCCRQMPDSAAPSRRPPRSRSRPGPANSRLAGSSNRGARTAASRLPVATSSTTILPSSIAATWEPSGERARDAGSLGYQMLAWKGEASGCWRSSRWSRSGPPPAPSSAEPAAQRPSGENRTASPTAPISRAGASAHEAAGGHVHQVNRARTGGVGPIRRPRSTIRERSSPGAPGPGPPAPPRAPSGHTPARRGR